MTVLVIIKCILAVALCGFATYVLVMHWSMLFANLKNRYTGKRQFHSFVPLVVPAFGTLGLLACSVGVVRYAWLYWVLDPGTLVIPYSLAYISYRWWRGQPI